VKWEIHLNEDQVVFDTPVHEFAHAWSDVVEQEDKRLADHIVSLVQRRTKEYALFVRETGEGGGFFSCVFLSCVSTLYNFFCNNFLNTNSVLLVGFV